MKNSTDEHQNRLLSKCCAAISRYQIKKEYDTTLSLYNGEESPSPVSSHHWQGSSRFPLWKVGVFFGVCIAFCTLMHVVSSLFSDS